MATPTFDANGANKVFNGAATVTFTWSHTCTGSNLYLGIGISWFGTPTMSSASYATIACARPTGGAEERNVVTDTVCDQWAKIAPATGANTVSITFSAGIADLSAGSISWTNVHQTTPTGTQAKNTASGGTATVNVTSATGELVWDTVALVSGTLVVDASQTQRYNAADAGGFAGGGSEKAGAASVTMSWTFTAADWAIEGIPLKPTAAATAVVAQSSGIRTVIQSVNRLASFFRGLIPRTI